MLMLLYLLVFVSLNYNENNFNAIDKLRSRYVKLNKELITLKNKNKQIHNINIKEIPILSPIKHDDFIGISSTFGLRIHPILNIKLFHNGVDIMATYGTNVYSTINGYVIKVKKSNIGYGNMIIIKNDKYVILYGHLNDIYVNENDSIGQGNIIGTIGDTGSITGIHLHYEVYENNKLINPLKYFYNYNNSITFTKNFEYENNN
ncbi:MAG: M23 family metallopeptidase [bacterium]